MVLSITGLVRLGSCSRLALSCGSYTFSKPDPYCGCLANMQEQILFLKYSVFFLVVTHTVSLLNSDKGCLRQLSCLLLC